MTACRVCLGGVATPGFPITSGIRQGCPLSPLLYVTVAESLLRALAREVPQGLVRAFADDTALVAPDLGRDLRRVRGVFERFAVAAHLVRPYSVLRFYET
eukprot:6580816-Lingulodinium_polyedra.AAC.1